MSQKPTSLVDLHCHIDLYPDPPSLIDDCERKRIRTLAVTTTPKAWAQNVEWTKDCQYVRPGLGFHPQLVGERFSELVIFEQCFVQAKYIGEVGLDGTDTFREFYDQQVTVFSHVLQLCASAGQKILSIHSLRAVSKTLSLLQQHGVVNNCSAILHWFTGNRDELQQAVRIGCFFSVNSPMARSKRGSDLISALPRELILTESDGPFTTIAGKPSRPEDVRACLVQLGRIWGCDIDEAAHQILQNLKTMLKNVDLTQ